jgi:hypothetical protein
MSGIRKYRRRKKALEGLKKAKGRVTLLDAILVVGLTCAIVGILPGGYSVTCIIQGEGRKKSFILHTKERSTLSVKKPVNQSTETLQNTEVF